MKTALQILRGFIAAIAILPLIASTVIAKPKSLKIQSISYAGTGTPQGTVAQSFSSDRMSFTLIFDQFVASSGPGAPASEASKNSAFTLELQGDPGGGHANLAVTVRGFVQLPDGVTGTVTTRLRQGPSGKIVPGSESTETFNGPLAKDYLVRRDFDLNPSAWSSAVSDGAVVEVVIALSGPDLLSAQLTVDSLDGKLTR